MDLKILYVMCLSFLSSSKSLKILGLFPHPGISHFHFFHPILRELADVGHDLTIVSHFPDKNAPQNYKDLPLTATPLLTDSVNLEVKWNFDSQDFNHFDF